MGKWDVDFDDYEEKTGGYDGDPPKTGTYDAILISLAEHTSSQGNEGLEWIFEVTEEPYVGWRGWVYTNMDTAKWKTQMIVKAISGGQEKKVRLDPADENGDGTKSKTVKAATPVRVKVKRETYDEEPRGKIRQILPNENAAKKKAEKKKKKKGDDPF